MGPRRRTPTVLGVGLVAAVVLSGTVRAQEPDAGPRRSDLRRWSLPVPAATTAIAPPMRLAAGPALERQPGPAANSRPGSATPPGRVHAPGTSPAPARRRGRGNAALGALVGGATGLALGLLLRAVVEDAVGSYGESDTALAITLYTGGGAVAGGLLFWLLDLP